MVENQKLSVQMGYPLLLLMFLGAFQGSAAGQNETTPTIDSIGQATIPVAPEYLEFELVSSESGVDFESSTERVLKFEQNLRETFKALKLSGGAIRVSGVTTDASKTTIATALARVRFLFGSTSTPEERARYAASVSDQMKEAQRMLEFELTGPLFGVIEKEAFEQEAIARATENALYKSDAVASLMDASIVAVQSVSVTEVTWGEAIDDEPGEGSDTQRVLCNATVHVVYGISLP